MIVCMNEAQQQISAQLATLKDSNQQGQKKPDIPASLVRDLPLKSAASVDNMETQLEEEEKLQALLVRKWYCVILKNCSSYRFIHVTFHQCHKF